VVNYNPMYKSNDQLKFFKTKSTVLLLGKTTLKQNWMVKIFKMEHGAIFQLVYDMVRK
jgi:hypothetical protein